MKKTIISFVLVLFTGLSAWVYAQATGSASGEVRRIDTDKGTIAIKHGAIDDLGLPASTLIYHADPSLLSGIKAGDKVKFTAEQDNKQYRIIKIK